MPMLAATNLVHRYGTRIVLDGVSLSVEPGERIGIVGRNGGGKTTLLKLLAGHLTPDSGAVVLQRGSRTGYLRQDPELPAGETLRGAAEAAFAELHRLHAELHRVFDEMAGASGSALERLMKQQERLERAVEAAGGYAIDHKIDAVLHGLGFTDTQFTVPVEGLSGGQRGRLALARLLLEEPDVLLLDEPTNHLDIDGRLWLESFLTDEFRGAVIMVSHDRYLLDNVVTRIVEVEGARLIDYPGNYADFREIRAQRRLAMHRAYQNQQTKFKHEEAFIRRYKAGQRAKQARGRASKLERAKAESQLERPLELETFELELPPAPRAGDVVVAARGIAKSYPLEDGARKTLFHDLDLVINRGERWGIIGPNGAGKSTLVRTLLAEQPPDAGTVRLGSNVVVGHYRQTHEHLDPDMLVYQYLQRVIQRECPGQLMSEQQARNLAGAFLFSGEEQERPLAVLSGGERSRAALAGLLASAKNLVVLDEPTNHLDIPSAERLEDALAAENNEDLTLILISHDRALIDGTCDHLLVLDGQGGARVFHGGFTDWHEQETARKREAAAREDEDRRRREAADKARRAHEEQRRQAERKAAGPSRNALARLSISQLEARIETIESRIKAIDAEMGRADVWKDGPRCAALGTERASLVSELEPLELEWSGRAEQA